MKTRLEAILRLAVKNNVEDIRFSSSQYGETKIEMNVDGEFKRVKPQKKDNKLIDYLFDISGLDKTIEKTPQITQFKFLLDDKALALRFAIVKTEDEAMATLRILDFDIHNEELDTSSLAGGYWAYIDTDGKIMPVGTVNHLV